MRRSAFTLVEMLVVIAIIVLLLGLSAAAVLKLATVQERNNTKSVVTRIGSVVETRKQAYIGQAQRELIPTSVLVAYQAAGGDMTDKQAMRDYYVQAKLSQAFPTTFYEAFHPMGGLPSTYASQLTQYKITDLTTAPGLEAAILLWIAMQRADGGTNPITRQEVNNLGTWTAPNGQPLEYLKDSWDNPLGFTRSAQPEPKLNPAGAKFVIYSAGRDGKLGMDPATLAPNPAVRDWNDNLTSSQP